MSWYISNLNMSDIIDIILNKGPGSFSYEEKCDLKCNWPTPHILSIYLNYWKQMFVELSKDPTFINVWLYDIYYIHSVHLVFATKQNRWIKLNYIQI